MRHIFKGLWAGPMEWELSYLPQEGFFVLKAQGYFSAAGFENMIKGALAHENWRPGMNVLCDYARLAPDKDTPSEMWQAALVHRQYDAKIGNGKAALVMGSPATYGLARIYQQIVQGWVTMNVRVFQTYNDALKWLTV